MITNKYFLLLKKLSSNIYFLLGSIFIIRVLVIFIIGKPFDNMAWNQWIFTPDTPGYIDFANELYSGSITTYPFRLPGYPLLLIMSHTLFSVEWLGTILIQQIFSIFTAWILYLIIRQYTKTFSLLVPVIFLFEPASFMYSYSIMPETMMIFFQVLSTYFILKAVKAKNKSITRLVIASSLSLCFGVFLKPILLYSFILALLFIVLYFNNSWWKRILYAFLFFLIFQTPIHLYREYIQIKFGVYSLTQQEFSEKAGRAVDIKYLTINKKVMHIDSLRAEIRNTLLASGYDYNSPNYVLYAHVTDSITRANVRKYPYAFAYHSFANSYMFFQPATKIFAKFLNINDSYKAPDTTSFQGKITHLKERSSNSVFLAIIVFSILFSIILIVPFIISLLNKEMWILYSPIIYWAFSLLIYSSVLFGRIARMRYRVTFIWTFAILAGLVYSYIKENGIKSIIPPFLKKDKLPEA